MSPCALTLVVPALNEQDSLTGLYRRVVEVFGRRDDWELVIVDDGSTDETSDVIHRIVDMDPRVVGVVLERRCGQSTAMAVGIRQARGRLIATLDADLQNDPADLPAMIAALGQHDAVAGYRVGRKDGFLRLLCSRIANRIRDRVSGDHVRDTGCSLKVFRSEAIRSVPWFEGMHRFLPTLLRFRGYSVIEVPVSHHPRRAGVSKYGIRNRAWCSFLDLLAVRWMRRRMRRPVIGEIVHGA